MLNQEELKYCPPINETDLKWLSVIEWRYPFKGEGVNPYEVFKRVYSSNYPEESLKSIAASIGYDENVKAVIRILNEVARRIKNVSLSEIDDLDELLEYIEKEKSRSKGASEKFGGR